MVLTKGGWCDLVSKRSFHRKMGRKGGLGKRYFSVSSNTRPDQSSAAVESSTATEGSAADTVHVKRAEPLAPV